MHSVNNTVMQFSDTFLLDYDEDPIERIVSMEYADVLVDRDGSIKWCGRKKNNVVYSPVLHDIECLSQVNSCVHNCDKIHIFGRSYGAVFAHKKSMLKRPLLCLLSAKER